MELSCTLGYMDIPQLQRDRLVYMGFVHCGGVFQMPMHYGTRMHNTNFILLQSLGKFT